MPELVKRMTSLRESKWTLQAQIEQFCKLKDANPSRAGSYDCKFKKLCEQLSDCDVQGVPVPHAAQFTVLAYADDVTVVVSDPSKMQSQAADEELVEAAEAEEEEALMSGEITAVIVTPQAELEQASNSLSVEAPPPSSVVSSSEDNISGSKKEKKATSGPEGSVARCAAVPEVQRAVDILLPCEYVLLERGTTGMAFTRQKVTLVLRNLTVSGNKQEEPLPDYQTPEDPETSIFEATVNLPHLPYAERLLHVECEGEEVACEVTPLYTIFYIIHIRLPEVSLALVAKTTSEVDPDQPLGDKSIIPLTAPYVLHSSVNSLSFYDMFSTADLLVSSKPPSQIGTVSMEFILTCEVWGDIEDVDIEWHQQKEGKGRKFTPEEDPNVSIKQERQDGKEDLSLTIHRLTVHDEGTYICAVSVGPHRLQQILQLHIKEPPQITLSLSDDPKPVLTCRTDRYYPLDVEVKWLLNEAPLTEGSPYTSSHRRNSDGTYNLSSHLHVAIPPPGAPPAVYTCAVSHVSSDEPIQVSINVTQPEPTMSYHIIRFTVAFIALVLSLSAIYTCARTIPHGGMKAKLP
ncbi:tapasin-related protein [Gastrophryne carolinensis]